MGGDPGGLPTGTVTFLFSDVEGANAGAPDEAVRAALVAHRGHVFKTIGEAFYVAFTSPEDALAGARAAQLAPGARAVRIAIHTGTSDERDGDYFGPTVNRVARLLAIGHGGQVLVSEMTTELVRTLLPPATALRDLGTYRLKDLTRAERVFQLTGAGLADDFPPLTSLDAFSNNLPQQVTTFVGRETVVADISALIRRERLVTVVGSGGIGKTRTTLEVGTRSLSAYGDGVWFVELATISAPPLVASAVAQAVDVTLLADENPLAALGSALQAKRLLLILDNCEHLLDAVVPLVESLLRRCPWLTILTSSRQPLAISGETTYRMPSLAVPAPAEVAINPEAVAGFEAIALFTERARAADPSFSLTAASAPIVADICRRLDGIALAIELAAARVKLLGPAQLRRRLDERFRILTTGNRAALPRQQTLRALIDWSFDLLSAQERDLFARLGIFVDGFTVDAAVALFDRESSDEFEIFDGLASLVEKSLVIADLAGATPRYRLLESMREYAAEKLRATSDFEPIARRYLAHLHDLFVRAGDERERTGRESAESGLPAEIDNARAALDWALDHGEPHAAATLFGATPLWERLGLFEEGIARAERLIAALPSSEAHGERARLSRRLASLFAGSGHHTVALDAAARAVDLAREANEPDALADALVEHAIALVRQARYPEARAALDEAERVPATPWRQLDLLRMRGNLAASEYDHAAAANAFETLMNLQHVAGNGRGHAIATLKLAETTHAQNFTPRAIALVREILPNVVKIGDLVLHAAVQTNLAGYLVASADLEGARAAAASAIALYRRTDPTSIYVTLALAHLALVFAASGQSEHAARLDGYCAARLSEIGFKATITEQITFDGLETILAETIEPARRAALSLAGASLGAEEAIELGLAAGA